MIDRKAEHNVFVIERNYAASPERVFAAWSNPDTKAQWFSRADIFEFRVGGREFSQGAPEPGGPVFTFDATYQEIVEAERIVYTYSLDMGEARISVSVVTVEIKPEGAGARLVFTEQGAYLDGHDSPAMREHGTGIMLDMLGKCLLGENSAENGGAAAVAAGENELVATRLIDAPREVVFRAWTDPELLASWWGPKGFTSTFSEFDPTPGGTWTFVMHGPNGADYPNTNRFVELVRPERIVLAHIVPPLFRLTALFEEAGGSTRVIFRQQFETAEVFEQVKAFAGPGNEENLEKLADVVARLVN